MTYGRKPDWVAREVLRLAVFLVSCRRTAQAFNRLHGTRMTVSHGYVHALCRAHADLLARRRRAMRARPPHPVPINTAWAMDLTQLEMRGAEKKATVLGIIDQGSRRVLRLRPLASKCTWMLLGHLCLTIAQFGPPRAIRTDNEATFTSHLWRRALQWMGIRHQRSAPGCPWQNGRIERFFGSLKAAVRARRFSDRTIVQLALDEFAGFYNHARPHQNLGGLTPMEAWHGMTHKDVMRRAGQGRWVHALDGRLVAYHLRI